MEGARTRGQPRAVAAIGSMVTGPAPHAVLLVGPSGVGKMSLALDLATALLCTAPDPPARPCRRCRSCRMVEHGNHPDLHLLGPDGPGRQVVIGGSGSRARGIRELVGELALLPVEGGARIAIVAEAHRMNEDAQSALLKTLEEPPAGVTIILCADDEDRLLPTVRSRCARIRLGPVGSSDITAILVEHGVADPPTAARLARLAGGRPGVAMAYARSPEASHIRGELSRSLLDLLIARSSGRMVAIRELLSRTVTLVSTLEGPAPGDPAPGDTRDADEPASRTPASERRRAAAILLEIWIDVTRDLVLTGLHETHGLRDPSLLEDLEGASRSVGPGDVAAFLDRLVRADELLDANVAPELVLDGLALAWPQRLS